MPKKSKAHLQRQKNLQKARSTLEKPVEAPQLITVTSESIHEENVMVSEGGEGSPSDADAPEFLFDFVVSSEDEEESIGGDSSVDSEISSEAELQLFIQTLQDAQREAQEEERQKNVSRKRLRFYTGNSGRTKQRRTAERKKLAEDGKTQFISQFFCQKSDAKVAPEPEVRANSCLI